MDSLDGEGWGIRGAAELVREIDRDLAEREGGYPELVRKGRMNEREADYQLAAIRDIREDLLFAFAPVPEGSCRLSDLRPDAGDRLAQQGPLDRGAARRAQGAQRGADQEGPARSQ
jgi:hypothetical protein